MQRKDIGPNHWKKHTNWVDTIKAEAQKPATPGKPPFTPVEEVEERLNQLVLLLPDLAPVMHEFHEPQIIARMCADIPSLFHRLLDLRRLFPDANISHLVMRSKLWLADPTVDMHIVELVHSRFIEQYPDIEMDRILEAFPWLLNLEDMQHFTQDDNIAEFQRAYGQDAAGNTLGGLEVKYILSFKQRLINKLEPPRTPTYSHFAQIGPRGRDVSTTVVGMDRDGRDAQSASRSSDDRQ
eukprot:CAMPEP_0118930680 /NCGR_PEP_ID=MMETSP1169-20130426/7278_1 /TAXON_ID=36882 /ORGANISM="Pyramimonas obovata, Strain CCMP722" /LENGTH=238 /DNA_ID=CAMNT_0006873065 /DNA_START=263 /DNA_END=979 /DNA_ORIENTATION=-